MVGLSVLCALAAPARAAVLYLGLPNGQTFAYSTRNNAYPWRAVAWANLPDVGYLASPTLGDLDGDGDADALVGESRGAVLAFENVGSDAGPIWSRRAAWDPGIDVGSNAAPALGDLDGDGDPDLLIGDASGHITGLRHVGNNGNVAWSIETGWSMAFVEQQLRPTLGDLNRDGRPDLLVGTEPGEVYAFLATGGAPAFVRAADWDPPHTGTRISPTLGDLDRDGDADAILVDGGAHSRALRNSGHAWGDFGSWAPTDPGSGPAAAAIVGAELAATQPPPPGDGGGGEGGAAPTVRLETSSPSGPPPLRVRFDASASASPDDGTLTFAWDFGDGTAGPPPPPSGDAGAFLRQAGGLYAAAKNLRDAKKFPESVTSYLALVSQLMPLTMIKDPGPVSKKGTNRIDRVARWYLQKIAHDLGGMYLSNGVDQTGCPRYVTSLQYSRESAAQAEAGGFPSLPELNGTNGNIRRATQKLQQLRCEIPPPTAVFAARVALPATTAVVEHDYTTPGTFTARVTVTTDSGDSASAEVTITVGRDVLPPAPEGPDDNETDPVEGFGAGTPGGTGGRRIVISQPTEAAVRAAFEQAADGNAIIDFQTTQPIELHKALPYVGSFVTIEGNGATLMGGAGKSVTLLEIRGHDVIVRNLHLRNGYDNLRVQAEGAYNVVLSHLSSTGSQDDGISIGYGAHDVTLQYCFLAGNTRSIFMKYKTTTNVSIHHSWIMKQWVRGPLVSGSILADVRNIIVEDWTLWGVRFEADSSGNLVNSLFRLGAQARDVGGKANGALRLIQSGPVYTEGNVFEGYAQAGPSGPATAPVDAPAVTTMPVSEMADRVRTRAGCLPRDAVDQAYIDRQDNWDVNESTAFRLTPQ